MIKCIAIDMDGTLLTAEQTVTEENVTAIKKAQEKGIEVVIATGRSYEEAIFVLNEYGLKCPVICVNGAEIRSNKGKVIASNPLSKTAAKQAAEALDENNVYFEVYTNQGTYTKDSDKAVSIIVDIFQTANPETPLEKIYKAAEDRIDQGFVKKVDDYEKLFANDEYDLYKLLAFSTDPASLEAAISSLDKIEGLAVSSSGYENLEITDKNAQKGIALKKFVEERGISLQETMAIGDNYNDLSMFQLVGRSVAMGNADEHIKAQCHFVTATNEESGVGKAIFDVLKEAAYKK
jgi:Cof subfamily protein (haloacid dehalogenase superfamily)